MKKTTNYSFFLIAILFHFLVNASAQNSFVVNPVWEQNLFPNNPYTVTFDELERPYFYVANDDGGVRVFKKETDLDPVQVAQVPISNWDNLKVMDVEQQGHYLYLALGSFFDINENEFGIAILDLTMPEAPQVTDYWVKNDGQKGAALIRISGNYAFLGAMNDGLYIFDISDADNIIELSNYLPDPDFPEPNPSAVQEPNARGMAIKDNLVFLCYDAGGLRVIDIADITSPQEVHRYINEDFVGEKQQAYNDIILHEDKAYVTTDFCGLEILDISNPQDITQLGIWNPWACETAANNWLNSDGHTNQLSFIPGHEGALLLVNANDLELAVLEVSNPDNIQMVSSFGEIDDNLRTWGLGINEDYIAAAYYFTFLPWLSTQAKVKLFEWELLVPTANLLPTQLRIHPNPASDVIYIDFDNAISTIKELRVFHATGQLLYCQNGIGEYGHVRLDTNGWMGSGLCFLELKIGDVLFMEKIMVVKP